MKRDASIELYRVSMMLGICFLHSITFARIDPSPIYNSICMFCVIGFVLISGWFGVRPSMGKMLRLYGIGVWCAALSVLLRVLLDGEALKQCFFLEVKDQLWRFWFLHAYAVLMLLAPMLNAALDAAESGFRIAAPMVFLVFAWGWIGGLWPQFMPPVPGLAKGGYSGIVLSAAYVTGRVMRQFDSRGKRMGIRVSVTVFAVCAAAVCWLPDVVGKYPRAFAAYNSPVVLVMAIASFCMFRRIPVNGPVEKCLNIATPSVFAIYLLQTNNYAIPKIRAFVMFLDRFCPQIVAYLLSAITVFAVCMLTDSLRRSIVAVLHKIQAKRKCALTDG